MSGIKEGHAWGREGGEGGAMQTLQRSVKLNKHSFDKDNASMACRWIVVLVNYVESIYSIYSLYIKQFTVRNYF